MLKIIFSPGASIKQKALIEQLEKMVSNLTVEKLVLESTLEVYQEKLGVIHAKKTDADHRHGSLASVLRLLEKPPFFRRGTKGDEFRLKFNPP